MIKREDINPDIYPVEILPVGRYAASIKWSDNNCGSIYPYEYLEETFGK